MVSTPSARIRLPRPCANFIMVLTIIMSESFDVAPTRKQDPGELFDWSLLAKNGIGHWPEKFEGTPPLGMSATMLLSEIGYDISDPDAAIRAFQRRYCPNAMDSKADGDTLAALYTLYLQQAV